MLIATKGIDTRRMGLTVFWLTTAVIVGFFGPGPKHRICTVSLLAFAAYGVDIPAIPTLRQMNYISIALAYAAYVISPQWTSKLAVTFCLYNYTHHWRRVVESDAISIICVILAALYIWV